MFSTFNKLNEGSCKESAADCKKEILREGTNPKVPKREPQLRGWASGKNRAYKNSRWEQLR
jgi:hypothetical protein